VTMMVYYCLSKRTPLLNTHTFTPVESELNTLSAAPVAGPRRARPRQSFHPGCSLPLRSPRTFNLPTRHLGVKTRSMGMTG
jgi:hypothetical protein